jgi:hypothetical protein
MALVVQQLPLLVQLHQADADVHLETDEIVTNRRD